MSARVIDTNVIASANRLATIPQECIDACNEALENAHAGMIVIDDQYRIVNEYRGKYSRPGNQPGDKFINWLLRNRTNRSAVEQVKIHPTEDDFENYENFPDDPELATFDPPDRKFVAVALGSRFKPEIINATDTDWWNKREALERNGVLIRFICPDEMKGN